MRKTSHSDIDAPKGWLKLISAATAQIHVACDMEGVDVKTFNIINIKQKFGGLRYYYEFSPPAPRTLIERVELIIRDAEKRCAVTCEVCAEKGKAKKTESGWISVLCKKHQKGGVGRGEGVSDNGK